MQLINYVIAQFETHGGERLQSSHYIPIIVVLIILFILLRNQKAVVARKVIKNIGASAIGNLASLVFKFINRLLLVYILSYLPVTSLF